MKIDIDKFPRIWLEDEEGNKCTKVYNDGSLDSSSIKQFENIHTMFINQYNIETLKVVHQEEVDKCNHPKNKMKGNHYNSFYNELRECEECGGRQTRRVEEMWSSKWSAPTTRVINSSIISWSNDLVTAIVRSGDYNVEEAILITTNCCVRCLNVLRDKYGLNGYKEGSDDWCRCSVPKCEFCKNDIRILVILKYYEDKEK